ncbi:unnamed protein product [Rotaria sp. Silwood2]|nr:unnamed protein product [Rotaria sp. Silwood2]CAF4131973.1 unnamed protein product [Rotaria sp. Silwood2]
MSLRRSIVLLILYIYRTISSSGRRFRYWRLAIVAVIICFIIAVSTLIKKTTLGNNSLEHRLSKIEEKNKKHEFIIEQRFMTMFINETNTNITLKESHEKIPSDARLRYSFIDIDHLNVDISYLDEAYRPSQQLNIDLLSAKSHPYTRILNVKGNSTVIIYNRLPQCYEFTMRSLLHDVSRVHSYTYVSSTIYVPFSYNKSASLSIARSLNQHKFKQLIYERHIYFFDFYALQFPNHPVWINLVRDPIARIAAEYERSREICRTTNRCFVQADTIKETLDECVVKRSPKECISSQNGIARMLPFFCGLTFPKRCQKENDWALRKAKQNINLFYTVVGIAEEFYKFLYVLEKLLPQYFKLARLIFMNQQNSKILVDDRDLNIRLPNENTIKLLKPLLQYEYDLYDYIKQRFLRQYELLVELDN